MISPLRPAPRKNPSTQQLFNPLHLFTAKVILSAAILLLGVKCSQRQQIFSLKTKPIEKFSDVVVGVLTTQEYFNLRFGYQLSTFLSDILDKGGNVIVSVERGFVTFSQFKQQVKSQYPRSEQLAFFESKCPVGYSQLICRTIELLTFMMEAHPSASWYIRIDDDTVLVPHALHSLLRQLNPHDSLGLGSPSFYFCGSPLSCTHRRYPGLPWKDVDQIVRLVRGGAGYVLSRSVILWIISNNDQISATAQQLQSSAEDLSIFYALQKHMKHFEIIQERSFYFDRPEVALRFSPFHNRSDVETPVSFHMNHNLVNGYTLYKDLNELHRTEEGLAMAGDIGVLNADAFSQVLAKIKSQVALKMMNCVGGATEGQIQSRKWDSELRDRLIDMVVVLLIKRIDEALNYGGLLETLEEAMEGTSIICVPGTKDAKEEDIVLETRILSRRLIYSSLSLERRNHTRAGEINVRQSVRIRTLLSAGEQNVKLSRMKFVNTIDLLVDCENDGKSVRHKLDTHRKRKKSLWEWNASQAVRGYARSRMSGAGYFWQMRYLQYISNLRDSWDFDEDKCVSIPDCRGYVEAELMDLSFYLRRGRVVLTERREHHLALVALQIAHVYICDEWDVTSKRQSLCARDMSFVKCVSNLAEATEALAELLLGEAFFRHTWNLPAHIKGH